MKPVAIKILPKVGMPRSELDLQLNEVEVLKVCSNHANIVHLLDVYENNDMIYIVQEYISGPNLMKYFSRRPRSELSVKRVMHELFLGLQHLHKLGIGHRDIKLDNIMMTSDEDDASPKFIDFGLSKVFYKGETSDDRFGTLAFCSPEIILGKQHTIVTDIWSIGILMHFLLVAEIPFLSRDKNQTKKNIVWQKLNFQSPNWQKISI